MYITPPAAASLLLCLPALLAASSTHVGCPGLGLCCSPLRGPAAAGLTAPFPSDPLSVLQRLHLLSQLWEPVVRLQLLGSGRPCLSGWRAKLHFQRAEILPLLHLQSLWKRGKLCESRWCENRKGLPVDRSQEMDTEGKLANFQAGD